MPESLYIPPTYSSFSRLLQTTYIPLEKVKLGRASLLPSSFSPYSSKHKCSIRTCKGLTTFDQSCCFPSKVAPLQVAALNILLSFTIVAATEAFSLLAMITHHNTQAINDPIATVLLTDPTPCHHPADGDFLIHKTA